MVLCPRSAFVIHTSLLFDPKKKYFVTDTSITIDKTTGLITEAYRRKSALPCHVSPPDIDLWGKVVLPGFVDAHTHIFLHAYSETSSLNQMLDEGLFERVIRAVNHCRTALLAGYTTYRGLGTEGLQDADTNVRDAINRGLMPGPRLFVATETVAIQAATPSGTKIISVRLSSPVFLMSPTASMALELL